MEEEPTTCYICLEICQDLKNPLLNPCKTCTTSKIHQDCFISKLYQNNTFRCDTCMQHFEVCKKPEPIIEVAEDTNFLTSLEWFKRQFEPGPISRIDIGFLDVNIDDIWYHWDQISPKLSESFKLDTFAKIVYVKQLYPHFKNMTLMFDSFYHEVKTLNFTNVVILMLCDYFIWGSLIAFAYLHLWLGIELGVYTDTLFATIFSLLMLTCCLILQYQYDFVCLIVLIIPIEIIKVILLYIFNTIIDFGLLLLIYSVCILLATTVVKNSLIYWVNLCAKSIVPTQQ